MSNLSDEQTVKMVKGLNVRYNMRLDLSEEAIGICTKMLDRAGMTFENYEALFDGFIRSRKSVERKPTPQDLAIFVRNNVKREQGPELPPKHERCALCGSDGYMPVLVPVNPATGELDWDCEEFEARKVWGKSAVYRFVVPCACSAGQRLERLKGNELTEGQRRIRKSWMEAFELNGIFKRLAPMLNHYARENFEATEESQPEANEVKIAPRTAREQLRIAGEMVLAEGKAKKEEPEVVEDVLEDEIPF